MADAACWGSVVSILMKIFPNHVTTIASTTEMLFGFGYMIGEDFFHSCKKIPKRFLPSAITQSIPILIFKFDHSELDKFEVCILMLQYG